MPLVSTRIFSPVAAALAGLLLLWATHPSLAGDSGTNTPPATDSRRAPSTGSGRAIVAPLVTPAPHWSFQPLREAVLPSVRYSRWVRTDLDRFVLAQLEKDGRGPQREADARTWL